MKRIWLIVITTVLMVSLSQNADAAWRGRWCCHPNYRPYYAPAPYVRPYYTPPAPVFEDRWVRPHYRRTRYGDEFVPGHWTRVRVY